MQRRLALAGVGTAVALALAGCGTGGISKSGDPVRGKALFNQKCAVCHTMKAAGANGKIGPNLDNAFAAARAQGFAPSTIQQVVVDQIRLAACLDPKDPTRCMPKNLVTGADADAVGAYVAQVAGDPNAQAGGGKITATNGKDIFQSAGCTGCHTLKDAGSRGNVGPNLDGARPSKELVIDRLSNGKGAMPSFKGSLTATQIAAVASYVSSVAGK